MKVIEWDKEATTSEGEETYVHNSDIVRNRNFVIVVSHGVKLRLF